MYIINSITTLTYNNGKVMKCVIQKKNCFQLFSLIALCLFKRVSRVLNPTVQMKLLHNGNPESLVFIAVQRIFAILIGCFAIFLLVFTSKFYRYVLRPRTFRRINYEQQKFLTRFFSFDIVGVFGSNFRAILQVSMSQLPDQRRNIA